MPMKNGADGGEAPPRKRLTEMTDEEFVEDVFERYRGNFTDLNFENPEVKSQLALDLAMLIGLTSRLLAQRKA